MVSGSTKMPFSTRTGIYGSTQRNVNRKIVPIYYETPILYLLRLVTQSLLRHHSILSLKKSTHSRGAHVTSALRDSSQIERTCHACFQRLKHAATNLWSYRANLLLAQNLKRLAPQNAVTRHPPSRHRQRGRPHQSPQRKHTDPRHRNLPIDEMHLHSIRSMNPS